MRTLARHFRVKSAELTSERDAERLTGYQVGGIGPLGGRTALDVYIDLSAVEHDHVFFNGGRRGLILGVGLEAFIGVANAELVDVCLPG